MTNVPRWYWVACVLALLWALAGCFAYWSQVTMTAAELAKLPQAQQDVWKAMPKWVIGAYAVAVWSALAGVVGLWLRRRWARPLLLLSILGVIVQFGWTFLATDLLRMQGIWSAGFPLFILLAGLAMLWLANTATTRGWLR
jgi:hypothetical protein